ncbi:hypothetical protein [Clostridium sp.]|uniref:hypothetical protein n=1 Tax=Clostridium sp. TaxID=1506 RepID=UPI00262FD73F|nr:hypothetical protein [Clostridium sp.]
MSGDIKKYIYIIGGICIVFIVGSVILRLLPWLLLIGLISYVGVKIAGFIKDKKAKKGSDNYNNSNDYQSYEIETDDYTNGEIIDVEYEDIDNKAQSKK